MKRSTLKILRDYGLTTAIAMIAALFIRHFIIESYRMPSMGMKPTLLPGDIIFVAKWPYQITSFHPQVSFPNRGDIIVFSESVDSEYASSSDYIKRVIGLPGDRISLKKGQVTLNNVKLYSPQKSNGQTGGQKTNDQKMNEKAGKVNCGIETLPDGQNYSVCIESPFPPDLTLEKVPDDKVFVLGDFRNVPSSKNKIKQKGWGLIPVSSIKGKALWIWLSVSKNKENL